MLPHDRFFFENPDQPRMNLIKPSWDQTEADHRAHGFTQYALQNPFPVKPWTATRCQHVGESHAMSNIHVSLTHLVHYY